MNNNKPQTSPRGSCCAAGGPLEIAKEQDRISEWNEEQAERGRRRKKYKHTESLAFCSCTCFIRITTQMMVNTHSRPQLPSVR